MSFRPKACVVLLCDGGCDDKGWPAIIPYFDSPAEAVRYAEGRKWRFVGGKALCNDCASRADCADTGHRWGVWKPLEMHGLAYRRRYCRRCSVCEFDPPYRVVRDRLRVLDDVEAVLQAADLGGH